MEQEERVTTDDLLCAVKTTRDFRRFRTDHSCDMVVPTLAEYLATLCRNHNDVPERVIKRAQLDRVYGHQIFSGQKRPSRDKVIQLAFGFFLSAEQTQVLLRIARKNALYPRMERDAALLYCLSKHKNVLDAQEMLCELGLPLLGDDPERE